MSSTINCFILWDFYNSIWIVHVSTSGHPSCSPLHDLVDHVLVPFPPHFWPEVVDVGDVVLEVIVNSRNLDHQSPIVTEVIVHEKYQLPQVENLESHIDVEVVNPEHFKRASTWARVLVKIAQWRPPNELKLRPKRLLCPFNWVGGGLPFLYPSL